MNAPAIRADGTVMGFDVGARRIGVAIGSAFSGQGRPLAVVDVHDDVIDWSAVDRLHKEWRPDGFVVGDPMTLDGGDQPIRRRAQAFARALRERYRKPVVMVDERSSSIEAAGRFAQQRAEGRSRRKDAVALDAVAAAIIVERWLARRRHRVGQYAAWADAEGPAPPADPQGPGDPAAAADARPWKRRCARRAAAGRVRVLRTVTARLVSSAPYLGGDLLNTAAVRRPRGRNRARR